jgi:copper homeostasis protein CutC
MNQKRILEICANSAASCVEAEAGGAARVELCAGIPEGGTTPSYGEIRMAKELTSHIDINVIIRPRGGDFLYTPAEIQSMLYDIELAKQLGVHGVVFGCLTKEGDDNVHYQNCEMLVNELVRHGKIFSQISYPMRSHGIYEGEGTSLHLRKTMADYWLKNLPAGGK